MNYPRPKTDHPARNAGRSTRLFRVTGTDATGGANSAGIVGTLPPPDSGNVDTRCAAAARTLLAFGPVISHARLAPDRKRCNLTLRPMYAGAAAQATSIRLDSARRTL